jgi:hypothetical protein
LPLIDHVAVISLTSDISTRSLLQVTAALQKQVMRDFAPQWGISGTVDPFEELESVPSDYHPVVLFGETAELAVRLEQAIGEPQALDLLARFDRDRLEGIHLNALTRQPFALVSATDAWTITLSHEVLEMFADPYGNRLVAAQHPTEQEQRVKYLVEVCDPCMSHWYPVNGVSVSDFYTPRYFDPVEVPGLRYSFTGAIERPIQVLDGGYLTFIDPRDSALYQLRAGDAEPLLFDQLAALAQSSLPLRALVDSDPRTPRLSLDSLTAAPSARAIPGAFDAVSKASEGAGLRTAQAVFSLVAGLG